MTQLNREMIILSKKKKSQDLVLCCLQETILNIFRLKVKEWEKVCGEWHTQTSQESWSKYINVRQGRLQSKEC